MPLDKVESRKPDQLVNLITLRFLDFGVHGGSQQVLCHNFCYWLMWRLVLAENWSSLIGFEIISHVAVLLHLRV